MTRKIHQLGIFVLSCIIYVILFWIVYPISGSVVSALAMIPLAAAGWMGGWQGGGLGGFISGLLTVALLHNVVTARPPTIWRDLVNIFVNIGFGMGVGWLLTVYKRMRAQSQRLIDIDAELILARNELESKVEERTAELQKAIQDLRDSEERLEMALQSARMSTWEWDYQTGQLSWSKGAVRVFGAKDGQLPATYNEYQLFVHPEDKTCLEEAILASFEDPRHVFEFSFRTSPQEGDIRWLGGRGRVYFNEHGFLERVAGTLSDITERKQHENALQQVNEMLEAHVAERTAELQAERDFARQVISSNPGVLRSVIFRVYW